MDNHHKERLRALLPNISGINLRQAKYWWVKLGGSYCKARRNGEEIFFHPAFPHRLVCGRQKASIRELTQRIRSLASTVLNA